MNWNLCPPQPRRSDEGVPSYVCAARKMARTETQDSHFALVICLLLRAEGVFFRTLACDGRGLVPQAAFDAQLRR